MLQTIREQTQGWIAGTIISIIIFSFAFWGIRSYFVDGGNTNIVVKVNGAEITKEQLTVAYERLRRQAQAQSGSSITSKNELAYKDRALQALIEVEVLKQASIKEDFRVTERQIDNYLQGMPDFQENGQFSLDRFHQALSSTLMSTGDFLDLIKTSLLIEQPRLGILLTSFAMPDEVDYVMSLVNQERSAEYINIPVQYFLAKATPISSDKIQAYYTEHKADYMTPEQVNVEYVQLSMKDLSAKIGPTDAELKAFYNENINSYTQPMAWKLADIRFPVPANATAEDVSKIQAEADGVVETLKKDDDFTRYAMKHSQKLAAEDWMTLNQVPAELQKVAAELNKKNQIIGPVKTSDGLVILKAVAIREPKIQGYDEVKDKVKETYVRQHAEESFASMRDKLADMTYEHPESLQLAAKDLGLTIQTSESFAKDKAGKDISQYKKVRDIAFSNDVLNLQNNSDVVQLDPETVIVMRVKSHIASTLLPLKDVSKQISDKLTAADAEKQTAKFAADLLAKLEAGSDPLKLAADSKLNWIKTGNIGRYSSKVDSAVLDMAFRLPNPVDTKKSAAYAVTRIPAGYAVVALKSVIPGKIDDKSQYKVFAEQVENSEGLLEYELYKQSQLNKAKIDK